MSQSKREQHLDSFMGSFLEKLAQKGSKGFNRQQLIRESGSRGTDVDRLLDRLKKEGRIYQPLRGNVWWLRD